MTLMPSYAAHVSTGSAQGDTKIRRYCLVTACRDEASFARKTLDSIVAQTITPALWVIVDDGSKDATPQILDEYAAKYSFIRVIHRPDRGVRSVGPGVIDAFYVGYNSVNPDEFEYVCKFDLDLEVPPVYFQHMMERMEENPRLGTCSGKPYYRDGEQLVSEGIGDEMSVGAIKFYRTECFKQIGGFVREVMWDGIDCHRCRMLGWIAASWDEPAIRFIHFRPMGASHKGISTGRMRHGFGQYFMGTGLFYMTASAVYRMTRPPVVVGGLAMWWGYVKSMFQRKPRYNDPIFCAALRRYQWACLLLGKRRATMRANVRGAAVWNKHAPQTKPVRVKFATGSGSSTGANAGVAMDPHT